MSCIEVGEENVELEGEGKEYFYRERETLTLVGGRDTDWKIRGE